MRATHIPRRPKKKPLRGKKVGSAEKKPRLPQTVGHRVYQGRYIPAGWIHTTTDPPRLMALAEAVSRLRFGFASLAWSCPRYAISDGTFALAFGGSKLRFAFAFACRRPRYAISDGGFAPRYALCDGGGVPVGGVILWIFLWGGGGLFLWWLGVLRLWMRWLHRLRWRGNLAD